MPTPAELFSLSGSSAVVTGAASGLGAVFVEALAEAGADVACVDLDRAGAERTADRVHALGRRAITIKTDVTDEHAVTAMMDQAVAALGGITILINNAGIVEDARPLDLPLSGWQRVVDVNLTGVFLCARTAARAMMAAGGGGRIINIASILGAVASQLARWPPTQQRRAQ